MYNPPFPGQGTANYNTTKPCCVQHSTVGAVELIKQHALFEGEYLDCTKLTQPAVGAVELIRQLALFSKLLDYLYQLLT